MNEPKTDHKVLKALNDLIATCHDSEEGYAKAAKGVHQTHLSDRLTSLSGQREQWASELKSALEALGSEGSDNGSFGGILHPGWVDLETRLAGKSESEILRECLLGDSGTVKHYDHALSLELPLDVQRIVDRQYGELQKQIIDLTELTGKGRAQHA